MKASRAAIKTAKAVVSVEERLVKVETQLALVNRTLQQLIEAVSVDKPSGPGPDAPKARTVRKRGGA